ncbi:DNA-directed RNA polymerase subunit RPC12/RpoP [Siphonobacter sp. BAB-5404]|nr:DNA-directed RNA polymerase subunit RPC12/RpoP [Siphonobacter sp. SORGH_AS_0500]
MFPITQKRQCPYCRSTSIERQSRPVLVRFLFFFTDARYYQCERCRRYFVKVNNKTSKRESSLSQ